MRNNYKQHHLHHPVHLIIRRLFTKLFEEGVGGSHHREIQELKQLVTDSSLAFDNASKGVEKSRLKVHDLTKQYECIQKKHLSLMMRRDSWNEDDIQVFADVTSKEVKIRKELEDGRRLLRESEEQQEHWQLQYMDALRKRYHEEQLWQDKWRVFSTYGTWTLIGLNSIIFIGGQYFYQVREEERNRHLENLLDHKLSALDQTLMIKYQRNLNNETNNNKNKKQQQLNDSISTEDNKQQDGNHKINNENCSQQEVKEATEERIEHQQESVVDLNLDDEYNSIRWLKESFLKLHNSFHPSSFTLGALVAGGGVFLLSVAANKR